MSEEVVEQETESEVVESDQNTAEQETAPVEQTDEAKTEVKAEEKKTDEPPEKPSKNRFERRLGNAYRKLGEAEARAQMLQQQLDQLKQPPQQDSGAPKLEQFEFDAEKYARAYADYEKTKAIKEFQQAQQATQSQAAQRQLVENWSDRAAKAYDKYDDFDEVVGELKPTTPWAIAIMQAENGPDIAHYLGKNTKEAQRLISLDPVSQIREIGRLEAKLSLEPVVKQPSKAPAPITPIGGNKSNIEKDPGDMSQSEFEKWRKTIIAKR